MRPVTAILLDLRPCPPLASRMLIRQRVTSPRRFEILSLVGAHGFSEDRDDSPRRSTRLAVSASRGLVDATPGALISSRCWFCHNSVDKDSAAQDELLRKNSCIEETTGIRLALVKVACALSQLPARTHNQDYDGKSHNKLRQRVTNHRRFEILLLGCSLINPYILRKSRPEPKEYSPNLGYRPGRKTLPSAGS